MSKPVAWSYSSLTKFEQCPRQYEILRVKKLIKEPESEQLKWGNEVHKALELRVLKDQPLPETMQQFEPMAARIAATPGDVKAEDAICINANYQPVTWFSKDAWCRGKLDISVERDDKLFVGDWKTGKPVPESDQLKLFAALAMTVKPHINRVISAFLWLKTGKVDSETYTRDQLPQLWQEFLPRVQRIEIAMETDKFPPRPSGLCGKWCPVSKSMCEYSGRP